MKKIIRLTESDLVKIIKRVISEQPTPPANLPWIDNKGNYKNISTKEDVVKANKKYLGLPADDANLTTKYLGEVKQKLKQAGIGDSEIELLGNLAGFIPYFETAIDLESIVSGIINNDKEQANSGIVGMVAPFAGKLVLNLVDYFNEKTFGREKGQEVSGKRKDIINMTDSERIKLYQKYGMGGYDKWVADGKPKL
jgi:hypothetical protein